MKRAIAYLSFLFVSIGVVAWAGIGQDPTSIPFVRRQASTPGSQEIGHANLSGTIIAGQHVGGGAGLTNVNADLLDGLNSTAFLQGVPNPLTLSGSSATHIISGSNTSATSGSTGIYGESTAASGSTAGGRFLTLSATGRGVSAIASSATGSTFAVYAQSNSVDGRGVFGNAAADSGAKVGV